MISLHLIDSNKHLVSPTLPEEIRKNSLAMEILCTSSVWSEGYKRDRDDYFSCMAELGGYLDAMLSISEQEDSNIMVLTKSIRVIIATTIAVRALPDSHRLKTKLQWRLRALEHFSSASEGPSFSRNRAHISQDLETKLWPEVKKVSASKVNQIKSQYPKVALDASIVTPNSTTISEINLHFFEILADMLKTDVSNLIQSEVKEEIDYIFSSWRRPHLLLDYYRMHATNPDIQIEYRRFLKALFGVSNETVDDIRFGDKLNRVHLDRFPAQLVEAWKEGRVISNGFVRRLPGYNDPQTLFMLGEDVNTCMSIRSKQKGSNRGLLGYLLHGNCRVLGVKDETGAMIARVIVQLLIDEALYVPVLYVQMPQGDENRFLEVWSLIHY